MKKTQLNRLAAMVKSATFGGLRKARVAIVTGMMLLSCSVLSAELITFDDLPPISNDAPVPSGYKGLEWDNVHYINGADYPGSGYEYGTVSQPYTALNAYRKPMSIEGNLFYFASGYFTSAWNLDLTVSVKGYRNEILEYETTFKETTLAPTFREFGWTVDKLVLHSPTNGGSRMVIDNLEITTNVPEPSSMLLLCLGAFALLGLRRRG